MQMWAVSRGSGWCHVWPPRIPAGWLIRAGGCRGDLSGRSLESCGAFFCCSVRLSSLAVTPPLVCINHSCPAVPPFLPGSCVSQNLALFSCLWEICTRCFVEGYVSPDYLCRGVNQTGLLYVAFDVSRCQKTDGLVRRPLRQHYPEQHETPLYQLIS